jgi:hypothetical protein
MKQVLIVATIIFIAIMYILTHQPKKKNKYIIPKGIKVEKVCTFPGFCLDIKDKADFNYCLFEHVVCEWQVK